MQKKFSFMIILLLILLVSFSSFAEEPPFSFRNGIQFGMTSEELIQKEKENQQIDETEWQNPPEVGNWSALTSDKRVPVSQYEAYIIYMLFDDRMQAACYDFYGFSSEDADTAIPVETKYQDISYALSTVYGENEAVDASDVLKQLDLINPSVPGYYQESDIKEAVKWQKSNVVIYQFYYEEDQFAIVYINPNYDFSSVSVNQVNVTGL